MEKDIVKKLDKYRNNSKIKDYVIDYFQNNSDEYKTVDDLYKSINQVNEYGCINGAVSSLIYDNETTSFYDNYKEEINSLLKNDMHDMGYTSLKEFFGIDYDDNDPLVQESHNKTLLAWYGFERVNLDLLDEIDNDEQYFFSKQNYDISI